MKRLFIIAILLGAPVELTAAAITHGPVLGRPGATTMSVWARTDKPAAIRVRYGLAPKKLSFTSSKATTALAHDNTGVVTLTDLQPDTRYFYIIETIPPNGQGRTGSFRTFPDRKAVANAEHNPEGLFNFQFEFGCGNNQRHAAELKVPLATYATMNRTIMDQVHFAILNGDWLYEEKRDYTVPQWQKQLGVADGDVPEILKLSPAVAGVWENYKLYWDRAPHVRKWHAHVPSYFTMDDHELVNDIYGCATAGFRNRRAVFRDPATRAWYDYLAWANPQVHTRSAHFGRAQLQADSDVLTDKSADFTRLPLKEMASLHIHFGGNLAGIKDPEPDPKLGDPNHGVYKIVEVLDRHRLRISPKPVKDRESVYSIGRRTYGKKRIANCAFYLLDTRSHRDLHDVRTPADPNRSMLGAAQLKWLTDDMKKSDAEFFFVVSTVNFMVPHVGSGGANLDQNKAAGKDDAWTVFLHEREKLIQHWTQTIKRPVFVLTGDLHTSFAIKITDNVWEFASGPHNSPNHRNEIDAGNHPIQGTYKYGPRVCDVRWSSYVMKDIERKHRRFPNYCVVQVNNVFDNPQTPGTHRWVAYPKPHVMFKYFDGRNGNLKYVETIHAKGDR